MADDPRAALRELETSLRELAVELAAPPTVERPPPRPTGPAPEVVSALRDLRVTLERLAAAAAAPPSAPAPAAAPQPAGPRGDEVAVELATARDPAAVLDFYEELKEVPGVQGVYLRGAAGGRALFEVALEPRRRP